MNIELQQRLDNIARTHGVSVESLLYAFVTTPEAVDAVTQALAQPSQTAEPSQLAPVRVLHPLCVVVKVRDATITAGYEYDRDFINLLKSLHYQWNEIDRHWYRVVNHTATPVADRVIELCVELLAAGFTVEVDSTYHTRILASDYAPEHPRWIVARASGHYTGWFVVQWRTGDYYGMAIRLSGARYRKPNLLIPPGAWDEVLDFADAYDFRLSDGAWNIVAQERRNRQSLLMVDVTPRASVSAPVPTFTLPDTEPDIDDELLDEPL